MEARELLLLLIAFAGALIRGALFVQPPNVTINEDRCTLQVRLPTKLPNSDCTWRYNVAVRVNERWDPLSKQCLDITHWEAHVPLGEEIDFGIETYCQKVCKSSAWNDYEIFHVVQNGAAGTGARDVNCTWRNRNRMECLWRAGEKASPDTSYRLFYWYGSMGEARECSNVTRKGSVFQCSFECVVDHVPLITISIQGDSGNIQPVCKLFDSINSLVKCDPPVITNFSKNGSQVFLQWNKPKLNSLEYEIEVNNSETESKSYRDIDRAQIPVRRDVQHTFRVRFRTEAGQWSEWSEKKVLDATDTPSTFPLLLLVLLPICVALLLVILLIYLKRIKLLILPKIPDPKKSLKRMFEEQNENQPTHETANNEDTHSLMIVEPVGNPK